MLSKLQKQQNQRRSITQEVKGTTKLEFFIVTLATETKRLEPMKKP